MIMSLMLIGMILLAIGNSYPLIISMNQDLRQIKHSNIIASNILTRMQYESASGVKWQKTSLPNNSWRINISILESISPRITHQISYLWQNTNGRYSIIHTDPSGKTLNYTIDTDIETVNFNSPAVNPEYIKITAKSANITMTNLIYLFNNPYYP